MRYAFVFVLAACTHSSREPAPTITSASASASPTDAAAPLARAAADSHVPLGPSGTLQENRVYSVDTTTLRFMLKNAMRATLVSGEHVWSGTLTVCDVNVCTDLSLTGPGDAPTPWHGFKFALTFVMPSTVTITR